MLVNGYLLTFGFWQKMLDYLQQKRDVGFFQSLAGLMQSCRSVCLSVTSSRHSLSVYLFSCLVCVSLCAITCCLIAFLTAYWISMPLSGRTKQRDWAWWRRPAQVINPISNEQMVFGIERKTPGSGVRMDLGLEIGISIGIFLSLSLSLSILLSVHLSPRWQGNGRRGTDLWPVPLPTALVWGTQLR